MLKKTITYEDFEGNKRTEDFWFHLRKSDILEMEMESVGGLEKRIRKIVDSQDTKQLIEVFKDIIIRSYGVLSDDGRRFMRDEELKKAFTETEAYSILFMELATNADEAAKFINGIVPNDISAEIDKAKIEELKK